MSVLIICALALALFQFWLLPAGVGNKDVGYLLGSRDNPPSKTQLQERTTRAAANLQESLAAFLALCLLSMIQQVDVTQLASIWLILRVVYVPCYLFGLNPFRSIVWIGSLVCLVMMAIKLV